MLCGWMDKALEHYGTVEVIEGEANGADFLSRVWAVYRGVPFHPFPAQWRVGGQYNPHAGPERNQRMLDEGRPGLVMAFPGGRGTDDMVTRSLNAGIQVLRFDKVPG